MDRHTLYELLGYLASILIAVSMTMRSIVRLRWINLVGAACFTVYGLLIGAYPVALLNLLIVGINVAFLVKMRRRHEAFSVVEMAPDAPYVREFLSFYGPDIRRFQPEFSFEPSATTHVIATLRDLVPAGLLILTPGTGDAQSIALDFVTPAYRDLKVGRYLFAEHPEVLARLGVEALETAPGTDAHRSYLEAVGFTPTGDRYRLDLSTGSREPGD